LSKTILVTGAGGFIGCHLCNDLAKRGNSVIGIDLYYPENFKKDHENSLQLVSGDYRSHSLMKELLRGVEVIFHLASAHREIRLPESEYWDINVHSLRPFIELADQSGVKRFVHVSSTGVYGNLETWPADEETACKPQNVYGETKMMGEIEAKRYYEETNFPIVILRPSWVYGSGCPRTLKIYKALHSRHFVMIGRGNNLRHPVYIQDMLSAFILAMEAESAVGETFVIGGNQAYTTTELVESFCKALDLPKYRIKLPMSLGKFIALGSEILFRLSIKEPPVSRRSLEFFNTNNSFDISKAKKILGFNPSFSLAEGLKETQPWFVRNA
jgi:nucleoside-diphosphate-sugar epimerase